MKNYRTFAVTFRGGISTMSILKAFRRLSVKIAAFFSKIRNAIEKKSSKNVGNIKDARTCALYYIK